MHLLRQHHRAVAAAAARHQRPQRLRGRAAGAEDPVVDLPQVARAADDQALRLLARVALRVGVGLVLGGEMGIGGVHAPPDRRCRGAAPASLPCRAARNHVEGMPPISTLSRIVLVLLVVSALVRIAMFAMERQ
ncbi:hypothetical protein [Teichococcus aestuarii]|uniref:hypothetical protein n=1 Tax=Teichococcus aestuarii TaxID=568898 RepID=UPI001FE8FC8E|nr:hypothetical protein [Pseudoroseomonas aestuarii]